MAPAASADEAKMYHRMAEWYDRPECDALRAAWGAWYRDSGFAVWDCHISKKCC